MENNQPQEQKLYHMSVNIVSLIEHIERGHDNHVLKTPTGQIMSTRKALIELKRYRRMKHKVAPVGTCDNFDYIKGCLGHITPEQ